MTTTNNYKKSGYQMPMDPPSYEETMEMDYKKKTNNNNNNRQNNNGTSNPSPSSESHLTFAFSPHPRTRSNYPGGQSLTYGLFNRDFNQNHQADGN
ncbi:Cmi8p NDAI_0H01090 [Naumovozyma dairenensis CBS 421]|uniref:Uncharacterized protein n=1 Tax=Naumovozyma dairenensis (strain ATCC 10597 / BCRC 20456 / CBS 421 / NBRC 0211 / NRRL Y-12639) TaxID=1071378 RepID=G0WES2_NAUDC|nr:hypothetical protein NDAI_0H01090 [Naumovozyma dairenensis CBS 421]CCD26283.1 hypothetical protein NDAI_0H01090 [Naumovozyma dairenensis CBS 421]